MLCVRELPHLEYHVTRFQRPRIKKGRVREIIRKLRIDLVQKVCASVRPAENGYPVGGADALK